MTQLFYLILGLACFVALLCLTRAVANTGPHE